MPELELGKLPGATGRGGRAINSGDGSGVLFGRTGTGAFPEAVDGCDGSTARGLLGARSPGAPGHDSRCGTAPCQAAVRI